MQAICALEEKMKALNRALVIAFILMSVLGGIFAYLYFNGLSGQHVYETHLDGEIKIACVGDSVTYGHGVSGWISNNYPKQLDTLLGEGYCVNNYGHSGATVQNTGDQPYITYSEYSESLAFDADIIIFMMGSNDSKQENWHGEEAFRQQYLQRLSEYKADNSDVRIILATPPVAFYPEGATEGLTNYDIDPAIVAEIADIVRDIAATEGYELVDVYALTDGHREYFLSDNVHPNKDGASFLAKTFYDYLVANP
jgi:lysophospholipase L1-like esterase